MKRMLLLFCTLLLLGAAPVSAQQKQEKWQGIDKTVVEKYGQEYGHPPRQPFINVQGDMLLFLFALAGGVGGFVMGYYWHKLFVAGRKDEGKKE